MKTEEPERAPLAFGLFFGVLLAWVAMAATPLLPALGAPVGFIALGAIACIPMFLMLVRRTGLMQALILTAATTGALGFILGLGVCVATSCIG